MIYLSKGGAGANSDHTWIRPCMKPIYILFICVLVFKNYSRSYKMVPELLLHFFWLTLYNIIMYYIIIL